MQPLFLQACPLRPYCIALLRTQHYFFSLCLTLRLHLHSICNHLMSCTFLDVFFVPKIYVSLHRLHCIQEFHLYPRNLTVRCSFLPVQRILFRRSCTNIQVFHGTFHTEYLQNFDCLLFPACSLFFANIFCLFVVFI